MKRQAKTGGEIGANGELYKGGQFIAESDKTLKGSTKRKPPKKQEIAPYKWEVAPEEGLQSIFTQITYYCKWADGYDSTFEVIPGIVKSNNADLEQIQDLVNRWNNGERWYEAK